MWVRHVGTDNPAPMDLRRHADADCKIEGDTYRILTGDDLRTHQEQGWHQLFKNHIRICPGRPPEPVEE